MARGFKLLRSEMQKAPEQAIEIEEEPPQTQEVIEIKDEPEQDYGSWQSSPAISSHGTFDGQGQPDAEVIDLDAGDAVDKPAAQ
jgi:hypothetical protein